MPTAQIISDNGKNFVSQKQKEDGSVRQSNLKFEKHKRGMKKALYTRLRGEVVDPEICQGFATDKIKAAGSDKMHPRLLHHPGPVSISLLTSIFNKSWAETNIPECCRTTDIRPIQKGGKELQKMKSHRPISLMLTVGIVMEHLVTNRLKYFAELKNLLTEHQAELRHSRSTDDQLL